MDILSLLFLAAALAMDAFSAAVTDGMIVKKIRFYDALKVGLFFGVFQFLMPCIGNLVSGFATDIVERFDHWIAFVLLGFLGLHMIWESLHRTGNTENPLKNHRFFLRQSQQVLMHLRQALRLRRLIRDFVFVLRLSELQHFCFRSAVFLSAKNSAVFSAQRQNVSAELFLY